MALVRSGRSGDQRFEELRSKAAELEHLLTQRAADVRRVQSALDAFKITYRHQVGLLHEELDEIERAIADEELDEVAKDPGRWKTGPAQGAEAGGEPAPRFTTDAVRKLFRDVAKAIHPDLARDESAREIRHTLMIEANRAYSLGDEERLRRILESWERSPDAVPDADPEAERLRLERRIAQVEEQLEILANELAALKDSPMWKLKTMVDEAASRGRDLVQDTVRRLKRDILAARNRLDAIRSTP